MYKTWGQGMTKRRFSEIVNSPPRNEDQEQDKCKGVETTASVRKHRDRRQN